MAMTDAELNTLTLELYWWFTRDGRKRVKGPYEALPRLSRSEVNDLFIHIVEVLIDRLTTNSANTSPTQRSHDQKQAERLRSIVADAVMRDSGGQLERLLMPVFRTAVDRLNRKRRSNPPGPQNRAPQPAAGARPTPAPPARPTRPPSPIPPFPQNPRFEKQTVPPMPPEHRSLGNSSEPTPPDPRYADPPEVVPAESPPPAAEAAAEVAPPTPSSAWKYLPLPENEPEPHTEFDARAGKGADGYPIVGARVRGKKHKHEGTHCDDWFEYSQAGIWTILVASDGGGSYKFSRCGAKLACRAAVKSLEGSLASRAVRSRTLEQWGKPESFAEDDLAAVKNDLIASFGAAVAAVKGFVAENASRPDFTAALGRPLAERDLSATLLVCLHAQVPYEGGKMGLVLGCSIGDGMVAVIARDGSAKLLMTPDSGEHSGETRFLDEREAQPAKLAARVFPFLGGFRAIMLMTDGVADDYFPNETEIPRLYADLILNGVVPVGGADEKDVRSAKEGPNGVALAAITAADITRPGESPSAEGILRPDLRSAEALAERLGLTPAQIATDAPLLTLAERAGLIAGGSASREAALRLWLDAYQVRGSFDDRTLLVMYK
jgi:hypothetical protein